MTDKVAMSEKTDSVRPASVVLAVDMEDEKLYELGYEQHMKRGFTFYSAIAFCLTGLGLLPSLGGAYFPMVVVLV